MEIIGKIAVKRNKKEIAKKTWLTIGLVAFALTMICEVLLGNFAFFGSNCSLPIFAQSKK